MTVTSYFWVAIKPPVMMLLSPKIWKHYIAEKFQLIVQVFVMKTLQPQLLLWVTTHSYGKIRKSFQSISTACWSCKRATVNDKGGIRLTPTPFWSFSSEAGEERENPQRCRPKTQTLRFTYIITMGIYYGIVSLEHFILATKYISPTIRAKQAGVLLNNFRLQDNVGTF